MAAVRVKSTRRVPAGMIIDDFDGSVHTILMSRYRRKGVSYEDQKSWYS